MKILNLASLSLSFHIVVATSGEFYKYNETSQFSTTPGTKYLPFDNWDQAFGAGDDGDDYRWFYSRHC
jgi:hypothetical protein